MKGLSKKIFEEAYISARRRELASGQDYDKAQLIRKKQNEHWEKYCFLKNLSKAVEKSKKGERK